MRFLSYFPFHSRIQSFPLRLLTLPKLPQTDTTRCLSLTGDGKSFPRRLYFWGEQSKVSTKQDTIFPHSHAQPGSSWATECYLSLAQQLCAVQMGRRREETICLIITSRFIFFLIPALRVASFCLTAPLAYFRPSGLQSPSPALLTSARFSLPCPCSSKWGGSFPQVSQQHGSPSQPPTVTPGDGRAPPQS